MDIVLEQLMAYVDEIASLVSDAAPFVWELAMKQVYVELAGSVLYGLACIGMFFGIAFYARWYRKQEFSQYSTHELHVVTMVIAGAIAVPTFLLSVYEITARLINPTWYAIKLLLETAAGGG